MKEHLGEFEELILLLIMTLKEEAYGLSIRRSLKDQAKRTVTIGAVHGTLNRLESKGFVESSLSDPTELRGGRRKRLFTITASGQKALQKSRDVKVNLWSQIPDLTVAKS
jgi:DNA-binding PadR family transcriptional regulator